jgi:hypothetical protein
MREVFPVIHKSIEVYDDNATRHHPHKRNSINDHAQSFVQPRKSR